MYNKRCRHFRLGLIEQVYFHPSNNFYEYNSPPPHLKPSLNHASVLLCTLSLQSYTVIKVKYLEFPFFSSLP